MYAKVIPIKGEIDQIRQKSFDTKDWNDLTLKEQANRPLENSLWNRKNI